jgi:hypothetical protein
MNPRESQGTRVKTILWRREPGDWFWQLVACDLAGQVVSVLAEGVAKTLQECLRPAEDLWRELDAMEALAKGVVAADVPPVAPPRRPRSAHVEPARIDPRRAGHPADVWREGGGG